MNGMGWKIKRSLYGIKTGAGQELESSNTRRMGAGKITAEKSSSTKKIAGLLIEILSTLTIHHAIQPVIV